MIDKEMITDLVYNNPLSLLVIKDKEIIDYVNSLVPYSSAFEIECDMIGYDTNTGYSGKDNGTIAIAHNNTFKGIPDIVSVENDGWEQRYRIPNGLKGIICLFNISTQLKLNSLLNPLSSIHYHVDCTDSYDTRFLKLVENHKEYILKELDTWLVNGNVKEEASCRDIGSWFKANSLMTLEFRLGEMTFDYQILLKRIIHCNQMVKKFKDMLKTPAPTYKELDANKILEYLKTLSFTDVTARHKLVKYETMLNRLKPVEQPVQPTEAPPVIRNRTHIFKPSK